MTQFNYEDCIKETGEIGYVVRTQGWILHVDGLPGVTAGEMVVFETGQVGYVVSFTVTDIEVFLLSSIIVKVGARVARTGSQVKVMVGKQMLGKTIDALGVSETHFDIEDHKNLFDPPSGIASRRTITKPFYTGVVLVDLLIPLGFGQRELILGDRKTGKSFLLWQTMLYQARNGTVCIYVAVGKRKTEIARVEEFFRVQGVRDKIIIVSASLEDSAAEIFLSPYTGMAIAEYFRDQGRDVLVVFDDMTAHAKFYRELALLSRSFPGRDSYPGDIFYTHSRLVERAGNFAVGDKIVSITCLPIVETMAGDVTGYIQTNLMSMTDGHIYFDGDLFFKGRRPAINPFISVTRVGRQTQTKLTKDVGKSLMKVMVDYERTQQFVRFGAELGEASRQILSLGDKVLMFLNQPTVIPIPMNLQLVLYAALLCGMWDATGFEKILIKFKENPSLFDNLPAFLEGADSMPQLIEKLRLNPDGVNKIIQV